MQKIKAQVKIFKLLFGFGFFFSAPITSGLAITPMDYYNSLVAGGDEAGFHDGAFSSARFNEPSGLAFDDAGNKLYVADTRNNRVRVVNLDQNNDVKTLSGTGVAGAADGPLSSATFNAPKKLAMLAGNRLAVFDAGNGSIRLIDLQDQKVSTAAKGFNIRDMLYRLQDNSLYFSESDKVERMDMKTFVVSKVFGNNPQVPSPSALCLYHNNLCVSDSNLPAIYAVKLDKLPMSSGADSAVLSLVGSAKDVLGLSASDGVLYALLRGGFLAKVGLPDSTILKFPTPWGFLFKNQDHQGQLTLFNIQADTSAGFMASPNEPRKFFIAGEYSVVSVTDYDFEKWWPAFGGGERKLTDFDYPAKKPARTFRILTIGSSINSQAVPIPADPNAPINEDDMAGDSMAETYSKKLELLLNTESALRNSNIHFEVLNLTRRGEPTISFAYEEVPELVKKYDIDLVLGFAGLSGYRDYFISPVSPEGIPTKPYAVDRDYMQKTLSSRAAPGAATDLIKRCKEIKVPISEKQDFPGDAYWSLFCTGDSQIQNDLKTLEGQRWRLLQEKINSMKTSNGNNSQLVIFYVPCNMFLNDCSYSFWKDLCAQYQLKFLDLSESYNALKISYYPTNLNHYTAYGNELIARLLGHYLIEGKFVPF